MSKLPRFNYFLYTSDNIVQRKSANWNAPLPLDRNTFTGEPSKTTGNPFTFGDYFESIHAFLTHPGIDSIADHASEILGVRVSKDSVEDIHITVEKHGEYYHPSRIVTKLRGRLFSFVVNVAASEPGKRLIKNEFIVLQNLYKKFSPSFLPKVFCLEESIKHSNHKVSMFLGEWFEGLHEFHISYDPEAGINRIKVWSEDGGFFLSDAQTAKLYQQASKILTYYYSIDTLEQILSWHHAAGDFVVSITDDDIYMKLITVRNYASMFKDTIVSETGKHIESVLEALVLFLLQMTIRMRLDRIDGVGQLMWSDDIAIKSSLLGFCEGLKINPSIGFQKDFVDVFLGYLSKFSESMLYDLGASIVNWHYQNIEEIDLIRCNLNEHIQILYAAIVSTVNQSTLPA